MSLPVISADRPPLLCSRPLAGAEFSQEWVLPGAKELPLKSVPVAFAAGVKPEHTKA